MWQNQIAQFYPRRQDLNTYNTETQYLKIHSWDGGYTYRGRIMDGLWVDGHRVCTCKSERQHEDKTFLFKVPFFPPRKQACMAYITGRCLTVRKEKHANTQVKTEHKEKQQFILLHEFIALWLKIGKAQANFNFLRGCSAGKTNKINNVNLFFCPLINVLSFLS